MSRNVLSRLLRRQYWSRKFLNSSQNKRFYSDDLENGHAPNSFVPRRVLKRRQQSNDESKTGDINSNDTKIKSMLDEMVVGSESMHSNLEHFTTDMKLQATKVERPARPKVDPETKSFTLFPGQGSQFVGMGKMLLPYPNVKEIYDRASEILKYDLLKLCLHGPQSELDKTIYCQPAVFVTSVAAIERMREENFQGIENTIGTAGFSVGEYAAMVFAGMMSFEDALKIVKIRAKAMQKASEETPGGMMTVFTFWGTNLKLAMKAARQHCTEDHGIEDPVCEIANYLFPEVKVIAGHEQALDFISKNYKDFGIRKCKRVPVSGAFHTKLMQSAKTPVKLALQSIDIQPPRFPVYSNVTCKRMSNHPKTLYETIVNQIVKPVKWEQIMGHLYTRDKEIAKFPYTYECGPGGQLGIFLDKMNSKAHQNYKRILV